MSMKISKVEKTYIIEIEGEDHTLGNLLASTLQELQGVTVAYYELEHPLFRKIKVYVQLEEGYDIKDILAKALNKIKEINESFRQQFLEKAKGLGVEDLS